MYHLYLVGRFLANILPREISYLIAKFLAKLKFYFSKKDKKILFYNLSPVVNNEKRIKKNSQTSFEEFRSLSGRFFQIF